MRGSRALLPVTVLLSACASNDAGNFSYNGLVRTELAFSTTGDRTQPADEGTEFDNEGRVLNLVAQRVELEGKYAYGRDLAFTGRIRGWGDVTNRLDTHYDADADLFAGDEYPGNGWLLSTIDGDNAIVDIPELYADWTIGNLWLRFGKQQIAWGDAIGLRILDDMISSLDVRRHGGNFDLATEEFLDERIGQIGIRANLRIPDTDWELEGSITDFTPTFAFPAGSAYANFPGSVDLLNADGVSEARSEPVYGVRLKGLVLDGQGELTFAYSRRPQAVNVVRFDAGRDLARLLATGDLPLRAEHPRIDAFGGAFSYIFSADPVGPLAVLDGLIGRVEAAYFLDKKFSNSAPATVVAPPGVVAPPEVGPVPLPTPIPFAGDVIESDELSLGVVLEKTHRFHPDWLPTTMIFEYWHRSDADLNERHQSLDDEDSWNWLLLSVTQNFLRNELAVISSIFYDTSGGWFWQPALTWRPSHRFQIDLLYNWFNGSDDDVYGPLEPNNEIATRFAMFF
jgi:hypothetical protein